MNLMHLLAKKDTNVVIGAEARIIKLRVDGRVFNGLSLPPGAHGKLRIRNALRWYPFCNRTDATDWLAMVPAKDWNLLREDRARCRLNIAFVTPAEKVAAEHDVVLGPVPSPVTLPYLPFPMSRDESECLDLVLTNTSTSGDTINLLVTETVPTETIYEQASGIGVEIGPGPYPRILPGPDCQVFYVERETVEEFKKKYNFKGKFESLDSPEARRYWAQLTVGRADALPFDNESLDFIFSADVVEHLVNPIGHLRYWRTKLRAGGRVLAIIPHISGCSDYVNRPTTFSKWEQEFRKGGFDETVEHHAPYAGPRGLNPDVLFRRGYSSHFSFFTAENLAEMLNFAVDELGYRGFNIYYGRNSKKLHFALYA